MKTVNSKVDLYLSEAGKWQKELQRLRKILAASALREEWKWNKPCYTYGGSNLVVLCGLKESCALGFLKGALLKDAHHLLVKPGEQSQSMRWMKFTSVGQISAAEPVLKAYLQEAIEAEKAGLKITFKEQDLSFPEEFHRRLRADRQLKAAFAALTPGRQRAYSLYFSGAKQPQTREARIEKCVPRILQGKGLNDR